MKWYAPLILALLLMTSVVGCASDTPNIPRQTIELTREQWEYLNLSGYYQQLAEDTFDYAFNLEQHIGSKEAMPYYKLAFEYEDKAAYYYELVYGEFSYKREL